MVQPGVKVGGGESKDLHFLFGSLPTRHNPLRAPSIPQPHREMGGKAQLSTSLTAICLPPPAPAIIAATVLGATE